MNLVKGINDVNKASVEVKEMKSKIDNSKIENKK